MVGNFQTYKRGRRALESYGGSKKNSPVKKFGRYQAIHADLTVVDGVILKADRITLPESLRLRAFRLAHDDAHPGIVRTKHRLRARYWWPSMDRFIEEAIRSCKLCSEHDKTVVPNSAPITPTDFPEYPWQRLAIDIRGPDSTLGSQFRFAIAVIDYHSKWAEVELVNEVTTSRVISFLRRIFNREGVPETLVSDNGVQFTSREFNEFLQEYGVKHYKSPNYHPRANGLIERFNRTLGHMLATAKMAGGNIRDRLIEMLGSYNSTPQATTGVSPAELLHGRPPKTRLDVSGETPLARRPLSEKTQALRAKVEENQSKQTWYANLRRAARPHNLREGDFVRIQKPSVTKGQKKYSDPVQITRQMGRDTFQTSDDRIWHANRMAAHSKAPYEHTTVSTDYFGDIDFLASPTAAAETDARATGIETTRDLPHKPPELIDEGCSGDGREEGQEQTQGSLVLMESEDSEVETIVASEPGPLVRMEDVVYSKRMRSSTSSEATSQPRQSRKRRRTGRMMPAWLRNINV
ncbi:uncharacterized protein K02A2.6-like [Galendromus occidentalis]|uniref:RNA-directed DNA polymerase n=1 Tax=Galendromus occidentalis TaxID=34638 RepID=A0AAJ7L4P0_9ACAR|nr:uncharacterized protein K02A2.6-like [Galendromus occidentalis]